MKKLFCFMYYFSGINRKIVKAPVIKKHDSLLLGTKFCLNYFRFKIGSRNDNLLSLRSKVKIVQNVGLNVSPAIVFANIVSDYVLNYFAERRQGRCSFYTVFVFLVFQK